jgi:ferric-dicitrate binding protein FerR (iron transport regulator)
LLVSVLAVIAVFLVINPEPAEAQEAVGTARIVKNAVTGTLPAPGAPILLSNGKEVFQNEVIKTVTNSSTLLGFRDNTQLAICPSADVALRTVDPKRSELVVFIASGCLRFTSGELLKAAYLNTPSAEIRTYGTIVTITVSARGGTTVSVAEGAASVTGAGRAVTVVAGQSTLVLRGTPPTPPVPSPPEPPIVTEMNSLLTSAAPDFGTRAAARSPTTEAPHGAGMYSPNVGGKIQSEIPGDRTPAFIPGPAAGSRGTHDIN